VRGEVGELKRLDEIWGKMEYRVDKKVGVVFPNFPRKCKCCIFNLFSNK